MVATFLKMVIAKTPTAPLILPCKRVDNPMFGGFDRYYCIGFEGLFSSKHYRGNTVILKSEASSSLDILPDKFDHRPDVPKEVWSIV